MTDDKNEEVVGSLDTVAAATSEPDATRGSAPPAPVRAGRRSIVPVGTVVGRYVLGERLGAGGMGTVYRAHDPKLDREIAVKLVSATNIEAAQAYLEREAQAMAKLSHPNVATVHDIGTWNAQLFIAMELCTGGSLAQWLAEPRPWRSVLERFIAAGRGLAAAHRIGLVHRDFKPDNVLIAGDETIKVSDFGLVRSSAGTASTDSNTIEGTPVYMAPEQLEGKDVDARADQFSFAVSVWEGVCGGRPFQPAAGRDMIEGMLRAIRSRRLMRATTSNVPNRVLDVLKRALDPDPQQRWPSLDALLDRLVVAIRPSRVRVVAAVVVGAAAIAAITAGVVRAMQPPPDVMAAHEVVLQAAVPMLVEVGELASNREPGIKPSPEMLGAAIDAFDSAFLISHDLEMRPRLARVLYLAGECAAAMAELETYTRKGGKAAYVEDIVGGIKITPAGRERTRVTRAAVFQMRRDCETDEWDVANTPQRVEQADEYWRRGQPDRAVRVLEKAFEVDHDPNLVLRMGDIRRDQEDCDAARLYYTQYLEIITKDVPEDWRASIRQRAADCTKQR